MKRSRTSAKLYFNPAHRQRSQYKTMRKRRRLAAARQQAAFRRGYQANAGLAVETKYVDGYLDSTTIHEVSANDDTWADCELNPRQQTAVYGCLPVPKIGTGYSERIGKRIFVKNIKIRGTISWDGLNVITGALSQGYVRLLVIKDTKCRGVEISAEDVLSPGTGSDGNASLTADACINCFTNPNGWKRYQVVKDKYIRISPKMVFNDGTDGAANGYAIPFKMNVKCNCYMNFNASAGAVGSIEDTAFHLIGAASNDTLGDIKITYVARTAFVG